jgi:Uma2 family endonuclease
MTASTVRQRMTAAEFFRWQERQEYRYELVDGVPRMMVGAMRRHDRIVVNLLRELSNRLRGTGCQPFTADTAVVIPNGNVRRPDVGVDCGRFDDTAMHADLPVLVVEVLSPSTRRFDTRDKLDEYKSVASIRTVLLVDPEQPSVTAWERAPDATWRSRSIAGIENELAVDAPGLTIKLRDVYDGLSWQ